jgi:hypothetical protein
MAGEEAITEEIGRHFGKSFPLTHFNANRYTGVGLDGHKDKEEWYHASDWLASLSAMGSAPFYIRRKGHPDIKLSLHAGDLLLFHRWEFHGVQAPDRDRVNITFRNWRRDSVAYLGDERSKSNTGLDRGGDAEGQAFRRRPHFPLGIVYCFLHMIGLTSNKVY